MEQIITLKVDLENPDEARHTIDELVKMYEEDKLKWTAEELTEAKHLAMKIMEQLCLDGYSIEWCGVTEAYYYKAVSVWLKSPGDESFKRNATCCIHMMRSHPIFPPFFPLFPLQPLLPPIIPLTPPPSNNLFV